MKKHSIKQLLARKRAKRVRSKMLGTALKPRVSVHRSNKYTYVQAFDDVNGVTIASANDKMLINTGVTISGTKLTKAGIVGAELAKKLKEQKVAQVSFDRGRNRYHGRVTAVAESLRAAKIKV